MKGIYILVIEIVRDINIVVGALKVIRFKPGVYVYIGSAQRNLESRIRRHLCKKKKKRLRWHIDYLLTNRFVKVIEIFYKPDALKSEECNIAKKLTLLNTFHPIKHFGSSDCKKCSSHLFKII